MSPTYNHLQVPHLDGITVHYALGSPYDPKKPTVLLIPGFMTTLDIFEPQFSDKELVNKFNLVAVDPLGHGKTTRPKCGHWTYWDTTIMTIQLMEALSVQSWFIIGTAQGGWIAPRMALLAGQKVSQLSPLLYY
jgi:pimeloyl-ACP methyl ester carboxylesterase